ncbi:hypothetical protein CVR96_27275, partial [Salmonella enterica subsp. enterica serovar Typhimurium]|uniref:S-layer homology domain-containing protein n=1 Tax=Salmonella enterica TaxID=28901 RepID=UPI000CB53E3F
VTNDVTAGYPDNTFKPNEPTTRAELAVFLAEATSQSQGEDNAAGEEEEANEQSVTELLKDAYDNEMNLSSYDFTSNMNFGISLLDSMLTEPGAEELSSVLENMEFS